MNDSVNTTISDMDEIDLKQIFDILISRIWLIVILPILFSVIAGLASYYLMEPIYETSTTIYINEKKQGAPLAYSDLTLSSQLVNDYRVLIKSRKFTEAVIKELGLQNTSPSRLAERITINAVNDTRLIEIKVQDSNPLLASNIANKLAEVFKDKITDIIQIENITVIDEAYTPINPIKPNPVLNIAIGFCLGMLTALGTALFLEYFDDKIRTSEDVERLGLPLLGTVPVYTMEWEDARK